MAPLAATRVRPPWASSYSIPPAAKSTASRDASASEPTTRRSTAPPSPLWKLHWVWPLPTSSCAWTPARRPPDHWPLPCAQPAPHTPLQAPARPARAFSVGHLPEHPAYRQSPRRRPRQPGPRQLDITRPRLLDCTKPPPSTRASQSPCGRAKGRPCWRRLKATPGTWDHRQSDYRLTLEYSGTLSRHMLVHPPLLCPPVQSAARLGAGSAQCRQ